MKNTNKPEEKNLELFLNKVIDFPYDKKTLSELLTFYQLNVFTQKIVNAKYQKEKNINKEKAKIIKDVKNLKNSPDISEFAGKFVAYGFKDEDDHYNRTSSFIHNNSRFGYIKNKKIIISDEQHAYPIRSFLSPHGKPSIYMITSRHLSEEGNIKIRLATKSELHSLKIKLSYLEIRLDGYTRDNTLSIIDDALQKEYKVETVGEISENTFDF